MSVRAIDVAFEHLTDHKEGLPFKELWAAVREQLGYDDKLAARKMSQFYTDLSLDGRFVDLENNTWNLKVNCRYDEVAVKEEEYIDSEESEEEQEIDFEEDVEEVEEDQIEY